MKEAIKPLTIEHIKHMIQLDEHFSIDRLNSLDDFEISLPCGSVLKNDSFGLSCLIKYLEDEHFNHNVSLDETTEEDEEYDGLLINKIDKAEFFENHNYNVWCEIPLEISSKSNTGSYATMFFAVLIYQHLLSSEK